MMVPPGDGEVLTQSAEGEPSREKISRYGEPGEAHDAREMKSRAFYKALWITTNLVVLVSLLALLYGLAWEHSTRRYLKGFADATVPLAGSPEEKAAAILFWMHAGPVREGAPASLNPGDREPEDTLNYARLLRVCGTATNAFINLAEASGLDSRRLLLLGDDFKTKHVVAEARVGGRWVVVDPVYRVMLRDASGRLLTKEELRRPAVFAEATRNIPGYNPIYTYNRVAHIRWSFPLRRALTSIFPGWEEAVNWTLILERSSLRFTFLAAALFCFSLLARFGLGWHLEKHLHVPRFRLRDQALRVVYVLFTRPS